MARRAAARVWTPGSTPLIKIVMPLLNQSIWHFGNTQVPGHFIHTAFSQMFSFWGRKVQGGNSYRVSLLCLATVWGVERDVLAQLYYSTSSRKNVKNCLSFQCFTLKPSTLKLTNFVLINLSGAVISPIMGVSTWWTSFCAAKTSHFSTSTPLEVYILWL